VLLEDRNAVIYGAGGAVGGAVARALARAGAAVFLAGRSRTTLEAVADDVRAVGGAAEVALVDAMDEEAVDRHADDVAARAGTIDVSFNAVTHGDVHGLPLLDMALEDFVRPVDLASRTQFLTTRAAARHMVARGSGVIMAITATTARLGAPEVGGTGVSFDAIESQCRQWAAELGPAGVRVVWIHTTGLPEGLHADRFPSYGTGYEGGMDREQLIEWLRAKTMLRRMTTLADVGNAAVFLASDLSSAMTATGLNITCGHDPG
jgi:3-oxoacyl-[acyl-carrier protein] reductase